MFLNLSRNGTQVQLDTCSLDGLALSKALNVLYYYSNLEMTWKL